MVQTPGDENMKRVTAVFCSVQTTQSSFMHPTLLVRDDDNLFVLNENEPE
jgi:hypothetical protein